MSILEIFVIVNGESNNQNYARAHLEHLIFQTRNKTLNFHPTYLIFHIINHELPYNSNTTFIIRKIRISR